MAKQVKRFKGGGNRKLEKEQELQCCPALSAESDEIAQKLRFNAEWMTIFPRLTTSPGKSKSLLGITPNIKNLSITPIKIKNRFYQTPFYKTQNKKHPLHILMYITKRQTEKD